MCNSAVSCQFKIMMYYFHMPGVWGIGVATRNCGLQNVPLGVDCDSWVLRHDGSLNHNGSETFRLPQTLQEGDVIVCVDSIPPSHYLITIFIRLIIQLIQQLSELYFTCSLVIVICYQRINNHEVKI